MRKYLDCLNSHNSLIFDKLNIENKYKFYSKSYGYETDYSNFAYCYDKDYKALTRLALDLFKLCDNYETEINVRKELMNLAEDNRGEMSVNVYDKIWKIIDKI